MAKDEKERGRRKEVEKEKGLGRKRNREFKGCGLLFAYHSIQGENWPMCFLSSHGIPSQSCCEPLVGPSEIEVSQRFHFHSAWLQQGPSKERSFQMLVKRKVGSG